MKYSHFLKPAEAYNAGDTIIYSEQIQQRIVEIAREIVSKYAGKEIVVVGLLRGAYMLMSDFVSALHQTGFTKLTVDFITVNSYLKGTEATGELDILTDIRLPVVGKTVLVVDDIIDTGKTMQFVSNYLKEKGAEAVLSFTLLDKPDRRKVKFTPDFVGFIIPDLWVQGYGMDTNELGRGDKNIIKGPFTYSS